MGAGENGENTAHGNATVVGADGRIGASTTLREGINNNNRNRRYQINTLQSNRQYARQRRAANYVQKRDATLRQQSTRFARDQRKFKKGLCASTSEIMNYVNRTHRQQKTKNNKEDLRVMAREMISIEREALTTLSQEV